MSKIVRYLSSQAARFCFPVKYLESNEICLIPFEVNSHARFFKESVSDPEMYAYFSSGPYKSLDDFITSVFTQRSYKRVDMLTFAIYQRQQGKPEPIRVNEEGTIAGMVSLVNVDPLNRSAEIGILQVLPSHRSKGIATKTGRLLVWHALQSTEQGGLGLVRLEWRVATGNAASERVAKTLGFNDTGLIKYERLLKNGIARGKVGNNRAKPPGTLEGDVWRDVKIYSISWDEWPEKPEGDEYRTSDVIVDND